MSDLRDRFKAKVGVRQTETIEVADFGTVTVQGLSGAEYDEYESSCVQQNGKSITHKANRALLLKLGVVDEEGKRVFRDEDMEDLKKLPAGIVQPLATAIIKLSGASASEQESIEKN
jgi:hypothetical protein